jgi:hypothetical protein
MNRKIEPIMEGYSSPNFDDLWVAIGFGILISIRLSQDNLSTFILYFIGLLLLFIFIHYGIRTKKVVILEDGMKYSPVILHMLGRKPDLISWKNVNDFQFIRGYMKKNNYIIFKIGKKKLRIQCSYDYAQKIKSCLKDQTSVKEVNYNPARN